MNEYELAAAEIRSVLDVLQPLKAEVREVKTLLDRIARHLGIDQAS